MHFAAARAHGRNALVQLIEDSGISIGYRDELYRTARDVSMQATQPENTREIDKYVLSLIARGEFLLFSTLLYSLFFHEFAIFVYFFTSSPSNLTYLCFGIFLLIGEFAAIRHLLYEGYDHIIDIHDDNSVISIAESRGHAELAAFLQNVPMFEVICPKKNVHSATRKG